MTESVRPAVRLAPAVTLRDGATKLDKNSAWRQLVDDAILAEDQHAKMTDKLEAHDWMHGSLQRSEDTINSKLAGGLSFLATVGATAPFVGLLGTVIGIYRALINIGIAGSASIDKVAGPVGEALIWRTSPSSTSASPNCSTRSRPICLRTSTRPAASSRPT